MERRRIALISTGGTIEKTYNELSGAMHNELGVLDAMLDSLELGGVEIERVPLLNKDSLDMTDADHDLIVETCNDHGQACDGVVVVHGTDRLEVTGERIHSRLTDVTVPVVLTGAMRPYMMRNSDGLQNLTEALLAVQVLDPGIYLCMQNQVLTFPNIRKDRERGVFVRATRGS